MVRPVGWLARALVVALAVGACTTRDAPGAPGIEWDVRDAPGEVAAVVSAGARVTAAGATAPIGDPSGRPAVWLSDDGRTWESASVEGDGLILALVAGEGQLLAVGRSAAAGAARAVAWTSSDGRDWKRVAPEAFAPRPGCLSTELDGVAAGPGGYVAVGTEWGESSCGQDAASWLSPDGKTWTRVDMPPGTHLMHTVVGGSGGYVAVGAGTASANEGTRGAFVFSPDGRSWTQADEQASWPPSHRLSWPIRRAISPSE